jgi:hypothetical protein
MSSEFFTRVSSSAGDDEAERDEGIEPEQRHQPERAVPPEHDQLAVRDVEDLHHAEHERQARRRQPVQPADEQPEHELLREHAHARTASGPR